MKIHVIGAGFVGQATGKGFLGHGHEVTFIDIDEAKVADLRAQGLNALTPNAVQDIGEVSLLTVNTPTHEGKINLGYIKSAARDLGRRLADAKDYHVVVIRSTVVPGTTDDLIAIIEEHSGRKAGQDFGVCMNPEFLREKTATEDFARPWLIVIGEYDRASGEILASLYQDFGCPIHRLSIWEAEMQKYVHNLFNAVKITFFNEMREVAKAAGVDAEKIFPLVAKSAEGMWSPEYGIHNFGPFDGSCLPKDTQAFLAWAHSRGWDTPVLAAAIAFNKQLEENETLIVKKAQQPAAIAQPASAVAG